MNLLALVSGLVVSNAVSVADLQQAWLVLSGTHCCSSRLTHFRRVNSGRESFTQNIVITRVTATKGETSTPDSRHLDL